jgi:hypothetical protein
MPAINESDKYVFFSKNTVGVVGKPVKIHSSLILNFLYFVNPNSQEGQVIIKEIENLRTDPRANHPGAVTPKPRPRNTNSGEAAIRYDKHLTQVDRVRTALSETSEYSIVSKSLRVFFYIEQKQTENDKSPTVYVSRIQPIHKDSKHVGGFYEQRGLYTKNIEKVDECNLENKNCFVSRATRLAPNEILKSAQELLGDSNVKIFYNPIKVAEELVFLKKNRVSLDTQRSIKELEENIKRNQKKSVNWIIDGEGAAVLAAAIANIPGSLETHNFKFTNARANLPKLMQDLSQKKAKLTGEFIQYSGDNVALLAIAHQNEKLTKQISSLPNSGGYENITRRYLVDQLTALGALKHATLPTTTQDSLKGSKQTFIDAFTGIFKASPIGKKTK